MLRQGTSVKYAYIRDVREESGLSLSRLLELLGVSPSGYYGWLKRKPSNRQRNNLCLDQHIAKIYWLQRGLYGYRRIYAELTDLGIYQGSRDRIRRRMRYMGLQAVTKRKFKHTTDSTHGKPVAANLLNQDFSMDRGDQAWVGDIIHVRVSQKWLYVAVVMDLYSRRVIGWAMSQRMKAGLVCDALVMALRARGYPEGVIVHTDRGSQYCSKAYQKIIKRHQLRCSMSGKGNCYDNAVCESFFHTLKTELVYQRHYENREQVRRSIFWYIEAYYNRVRRHSGIGYMSPLNYEKKAA
ncbi:MAG: IS3 family transposase [Pseudomonadales bacterium]